MARMMSWYAVSRTWRHWTISCAERTKRTVLKTQKQAVSPFKETACFLCGEKTEKAVFATFLSVFQIIPAASFVKITKSPETIVVSGLLTMVRGTGLELMQRVLILCCQRPDGVANTGFFEATVPAHAERCYLILPL